MKIASHQNLKIHSDDFSEGWIRSLQKMGVECKILDFKNDSALDFIKDCDGAMWHWYHEPDDKQAAPKILDAIEFGLGIPVFPNFATRHHYDEKVSQHYLLKSINAPHVKSWVFWKKENAENFIKSAEYPLVFKLSVGAGSANVIKIENKKEATKIVNKIFNKYNITLDIISGFIISPIF